MLPFEDVTYIPPTWPAPLRRLYVVLGTLPPFFARLFTRRGLFSADGRQLIAGKFRRIALSMAPSYAKSLQKKHGISGNCTSCGASCKLLFQCPHWDEASHLCSVYEDRPNICRLFPITPRDIEDRNIVMRDKPCGFRFGDKPKAKTAI